jgi:para-aminobenzoate synthetase component 1
VTSGQGEELLRESAADAGRSSSHSDTLSPCHVVTASGLPLAEELRPAPDPWEAFRRLAKLPHVLFLDSALSHASLGRYSFLAADPAEFYWSRRGRRCCAGWKGSDPEDPKSARSDRGAALHAPDSLGMVAERLRRFWPAEPVAGLPPFQGGAAGLFGYGLCHDLERLPRPRLDEFEVPELAIGIYDWVLAYDHAQGRAWIISTGFPEIEPRRRRRRAEQGLTEVKRNLQAPAEDGPGGGVWTSRSRLPLLARQPVQFLPGLLSSFDRASYLEAVRRAVEYTHAGDCFQVNLAQRLVYPWQRPTVEIYRRLRERNAAPFAGYFDLGNFVIASASPERFLRVENSDVETRPIKGTRPRGLTPEEDLARVEDLRDSTKDRAENVMIVDLLRNDLGRVCRYGSVRVDAVCWVETYRYVHHLVSVVRGRLREGLGPIDLLRAVFPGGSVTGAPKIRAMEIIAELEPTARGAYCGSLGYIGFDGSMDTNILIRTFTAGGGWVQFPVGGGIVADSVPEREYEETWHKAEGMLRALQ